MVEKSLTSRVETSLKNQFGVTISNASKRQVYEAMMRSVRDILMEKKFSYEQTLKQTRQKTCVLYVNGIPSRTYTSQ